MSQQEQKVSRTKPVLEYLRRDTVKPVTSTEFMAFWTACSEQEREQFYNESVALLAS